MIALPTGGAVDNRSMLLCSPRCYGVALRLLAAASDEICDTIDAAEAP